MFTKFKKCLKSKRYISSILVICMVFTLITVKNIEVHADTVVDTNPNNNPNMNIQLVKPTTTQTVKVGDEVEVVYNITPQDIPKEVLNVSKAKEIVLVLDSSGSMRDNNKLINLKSAAINFINKFQYTSNLKIAIVTYSTNGNIMGTGFYDPTLANDRTSLVNIIDNMNASGGTNTGEGLRKAEYLLSKQSTNTTANKSIVFMSDGLPTYYCGTSPNFYTTIDNNNPTVKGTGSEETSNINISTEYAKKIGSIIKTKSYNIFSVGYGMGTSTSTGNKKMNEMHTSMGGIATNLFNDSNGAIDSIFNQIADSILASYTAQNIKVDIPTNTQFDLTYDGVQYSFENGQKSINIPNIVYTLNSAKTLYTAPAFQLSFKVKARAVGTINFGNGINVTYQSIAGTPIQKTLPNVVINVEGNSWTTGKVGIEVEDSANKISDKYDSSASTALRYDKDIIQADGRPYKLFGKSYANFTVEGNDVNTLKYQIISANNKPQNLPEDNWEIVNLNENTIIDNDIDINNKGKLSVQYYNTNNSYSGNWNSIFSTNKSGEVQIISATKLDGSTYLTNNIPNSVFVSNVVSGDYKQVKEVWGYVKFDSDLNTKNIQINHDDGVILKIGIPSNGVYNYTQLVSDIGWGTTGITTDINLSKNTYYPIYMRYFNRGGAYEFNLQYKLNNRWNDFNSNWFYPSKSSIPVTTDRAIINSKLIKTEFPQVSGNYYVAYKVGNTLSNNSFESKKEGVYGPFNIDSRFELNRALSNLTNPQSQSQIVDFNDNSKEFLLNYNITPNKIYVNDIYKGNVSNIKQELIVNELQLEDWLPAYLEVRSLSINTGYNVAKINPTPDTTQNPDKVGKVQLAANVTGNIKYTLSDDKTYYSAAPINLVARVNVNESLIDTSQKVTSVDDRNVDYMVNFSLNSNLATISYRDITINSDPGLLKDQNFETSSFVIKKIFIDNSTIVKHGLIVANKIQDSSTDTSNNIAIVPNNIYKLGVQINTTTANNSFEVILPITSGLNKDNVYLYELDSNENFIESSKVKISNIEQIGLYYKITNLSNDIKNPIMDANKKYAVVYEINNTQTADMVLEASLNNGNKRNLNVKVYDNNVPNIKATLKKPLTKLEAVSGEEVEVTYTIAPESFDYLLVGNETASAKLINNTKLYIDLNDNFEPVGTLFQQVSGSKYRLDLNPISYVPTLNQNGSYRYSAASFDVTFKVKVKANKFGELSFKENTLLEANNYVSYTKLNTVEAKILFDKLPVVIVNEKADNVKLKVKDSFVYINKQYDTLVNPKDYIVTNNGETYKLYGQSSVDINFSGNNVTHLRYKFTKDGQDEATVEWKYISANGDVDTSKQGFLTQMPYDVSHMATLSNTAQWSNRQEVFKSPVSSKTGPISMDISLAKDKNYVTKEQVVNAAGQTVNRWVPKTLFVENHNVAAYASDYKEASKTWGYIKVPTSGEYMFRTWSDDGFYGLITVNGQAKVLGSDFKPRGSNANNIIDSEKIFLEAGKYYPIYIEYFNWGGWADLRITYKIGNETNYNLIDKSWFYPSFSNTPVEDSNNIFMGNTTVNVPTEPGVYTMKYETGSLQIGSGTGDIFVTKGVGSYGKFEIENRFELNKDLSTDKIEKDTEMSIQYTVKPKDIKITDLYKVSSVEANSITNKPTTLLINNIELKDKLPEGIVEIATNGININNFKDKIQYDLKGDRYSALPYTYTAKIKATKNSVIFNSENNMVNYRDVALIEGLRISQIQAFTDTLNLSVYDKSLILKHGLFVDNTIRDGDTDIVNEMKYTFGFVLDAKGINNSFTINVPKGIAIDNNILLYEVDSNEKAILSSKKIIDNKEIKTDANGTTVIVTSNNDNVIVSGKKYIVVYSTTSIIENSSINAKLNSGSEKILNLIKKELPDLF